MDRRTPELADCAFHLQTCRKIRESLKSDLMPLIANCEHLMEPRGNGRRFDISLTGNRLPDGRQYQRYHSERSQDALGFGKRASRRSTERRRFSRLGSAATPD